MEKELIKRNYLYTSNEYAHGFVMSVFCGICRCCFEDGELMQSFRLRSPG